MTRHESPELQKEGLKAELSDLKDGVTKLIEQENVLDNLHLEELKKYLEDIKEATDSLPGLQGFVQRGRELLRLGQLEGEEKDIIKEARELLDWLSKKLGAAEFLETEGDDLGDEANELAVQHRQLEYQLDEWRQGGRNALKEIQKILEKENK